MAESESNLTERTAETTPAVLGTQYTPTDQERKVFKECNSESFWYRSVPFSASAMALTHILVTKGKLTTSARFGSLPKVLCKLSYMKTCQRKFYNLENSPIGEALRQRQRHHHHPPQFPAPRAEDESPQFDAFQSESISESLYSPPDFSFNDTTPSTQPPPLHSHGLREEEEEGEKVKKKPVLYEELRNRNRENYDVTRSQKIEAPRDRDRDMPKMEEKKNKYGDAWEE